MVPIKNITSRLPEGIPVFGIDVKKDEVRDNPDLFIVHKSNELETGSNGYRRKVYVMYITRNYVEFDVPDLIDAIRQRGLSFDHSTEDYGKIADTDEDARMVTLIFNETLTDCYR